MTAANKTTEQSLTFAQWLSASTAIRRASGRRPMSTKVAWAKWLDIRERSALRAEFGA